jgi:hypothetical protein
MIRKSLAAALLFAAACSDQQAKEETSTSKLRLRLLTPSRSLWRRRTRFSNSLMGGLPRLKPSPSSRSGSQEDLAAQRKQALATAQEDFDAHRKDAHHSHTYSQGGRT